MVKETLRIGNWLFVIALLIVLLLTGCDFQAPGSATPTPASNIAPVRSDGEISAEGRVVPREYARLSFSKGGVVAELPLKEGDAVKKGDLIVRLEDSETLKSAIAKAEEGVLAAKQTVDDLKASANVESATIFGKISTSYDAMREAERQLYYYNLPSNQRNLDMFEASDLMRKRLEEARKSWEPYKYEDEQTGGTLTDRSKLKEDLENAESDYRTSLLRISYASKAKSATADLEKAMKDFEKVKEGQPDPEEMAIAEAKLMSAEASLNSAKAALDDLELRAPFSGTIAKLDIKIGENAAPNTPLVTIADFSALIVETDNLTEIEVVKIEKGQLVTIVADALPNDTVEGTVDSIAEVYEEKRGDVTYTIKLSMPKVPDKFRWGMTVISTFKSK